MYLYLGVRTGRRKWYALSGIAGVVYVVGFALAASGPTNSSTVTTDVGATLVLTVWIGGLVHAAIIWALKLDTPSDPELADERERERQRAFGRRMLATDPATARRLGIGRPDLPGSNDCHLMDFNHVPEECLAGVGGISPEMAGLIVATRQHVGPFSSINDMGLVLDLPPQAVDHLQAVAVFLPDSISC